MSQNKWVCVESYTQLNGGQDDYRGTEVFAVGYTAMVSLACPALAGEDGPPADCLLQYLQGGNDIERCKYMVSMRQNENKMLAVECSCPSY